MKYHSYYKYFKTLGYSFEVPKTDACDFCSKANILLKNNPLNPLKVQYDILLKKFNAYKVIKNNYIAPSEGIDKNNILVIEFDFAQNLPLPRLNCTSKFYKRSLWMFVFNVYLHNDKSSIYYYYYENE